MKVTEDNFDEIFKPQINHFERAKQPISVDDEDVCSFNGCMYETYGEEEEYVISIAQNEATKKRVWTVVEAGDDFIITAGFHYVNRFGYIITEKEWETGNEEVLND